MEIPRKIINNVGCTINDYLPRRMGVSVGGLMRCHLIVPETNSRPLFLTAETLSRTLQGTVKPCVYLIFPRKSVFFDFCTYFIVQGKL